MAAPAPWRSLPPAQTEDLGEIEDADPFGSAATAAPPPHATAAPPAAGQEIEDEDPFGPGPEPSNWSVVGRAALRGAIESGTAAAEAPTAFKDRAASPESTDRTSRILKQPLSEGWSDPTWWAAHIAHGVAGSAPSLVAGAAGAAGAQALFPEAPGAAALAGGAGGYAIGSMITEIAPAYQKARAAGLDHDAAVTRAIEETGIAGAFGAVAGVLPAGSAFGKDAVGALKRPISEALLQIFGAQPLVGGAQQVATGAVEGEMPSAKELATGYVENVGAGAALVGGHAVLRNLKPALGIVPGTPPAAAPGATSPEPPPGPEPAPASGPPGIGGPAAAPGASPPSPGPTPRPRPARPTAAQPTPASAADTEAAVAAGQPPPAPTPAAAATPSATPIDQARAGAVQGWIDQISTGIAGGVKSEGDRIVLQGALGQLQASVGKPGGATPEQVAQAKAALEGEGQSGTPAATPVPPTVPEPAADIHAQVAALTDPKNPKDAVFLAAGTPLPPLETLRQHNIHMVTRPEGTLLTTDPAKATAFNNAPTVTDPLMAHLLGYPETKPEAIASGNPVVVQGTDPAGAVVAETLASPQGVPAAEAAIQAQTPKGGDVTVRPPQEVTDERAQETAAEGQMPAVQQTAVQRAAQDYASRATDEAYRGGIPWMEAQSAGAEAYVEYMEGTAEFPAGMRDLVNPDTGVDNLLREYERAMESGASPQQAARHAVDMAEAGKGAFAPPQAANDLRPSPQPAAPTRVRSIDEIVTQDGVKEPKARQIQNAEMLAVGRPITMDEMAARRAGVAALPSSVPGVPPLQPSDARVGAPYTMFAPAELTIDPVVMQFKASDEKGVTGALTGHSIWEPGLANPITVWQTNDGRNVVVNGHQRLDLAQRAEAAGQQGVQLPARVYREADGYSPEYMRALGAYQNIAEGSGTPLDAARILRTKNAFPDSMRLPELPPHQMIVQQARGLANLSPEAFGAVENGLVPPEYAGMVGAVISEPAEQMAALDALARAHPENANQARINIADIRNGGFLQGAQTTLFGEEAFARSLVPERAKVLDGAMKILRSAATAFRATVKGEKTLTDAGNVLATDANVQGKTASERLLDTIGRNATTVGPYSDALNVAARALAAGKPSDVGKIVHSFLTAARELERGGTRAGVPAGDHGRGVGHEGEGEQGPIAAEGQNGLLEAIGRLAQPPIKDERQGKLFLETPKTMPKPTGKLAEQGAVIGSEAEDFTRFAQKNPGVSPAILAGRYVLERGRETGHEYLTAYDPHADTVIMAHTIGNAQRVNFPDGFNNASTDPTRALVIHHNHPGSNSLSSDDVYQLSLAGISSVVAHGHNGSFYAASLGPAADRSANTPTALANALTLGGLKAEQFVSNGLLNVIKAGDATKEELQAVLWDTINRVLHRAGMIDYVAVAARAPHVAAIANRVVAAAIRGGQYVGDHRHPDAASADEGIARVLARSIDDSRTRRPAGQERGGQGPGLSEGTGPDADGATQAAGVRGLAGSPSNVGIHRYPVAVSQEDGLAKVLAQSAENSRAKRPAGEGGRSDSAGGPGVVDENAGSAAPESGLGGLAERKDPLPPASGAPLFGEAPRQQTPRPAAEPTIRSDERQAVMPGMGPSAVQAQAARDQTGRGGLLPSGEQRPANEGLFAPPKPDQKPLFGRGADTAGAPPFQRGAMAGHPDYPHPAAIQAVIDAARHMTGNHIQIEAYDAAHHAFQVKFPDGHTEQVFGYALGRLIRAAIEPGRFAQNMNHEALHALKRLGVFTPREWATLEAAAERGNWIDKHGVKERYPELDHAGHIEEAIADEMGERSTADRVPGATPSFMARMLAKVRTFLARLRNLMRGHGFQTVDDVFGKIMRGEVGAREPGSGMEQIGPETVEGSVEAARAWGLRDPNELALGRRPKQKSLPLTAASKDRLAKAKKAADEVKWLFSPTSRGAQAKEAEHLIRSHVAQRAQSVAQSTEALEQFAHAVGRLPESEQLAITDRAEAGQPQPTPELNAIMDAVRAEQEKWVAKVRSLGPQYLKTLRDNYMGRIWANYREWREGVEADAQKTWQEGRSIAQAQARGKSPLKGSGAFLKQRTFDTQREGIEAGLIPVTTNPIEMQLLKVYEMVRFYHGVRLSDAIKDSRLAMWVPFTDEGYAREKGLVKLDDPSFQPRVVSEGEYGRKEFGNWYAPEPVARVFNNFVSRGLAGHSTIYDTIRSSSNALNSAQLSFSGFHATFVAFDTMMSRMALGLQQLTRGEPLRGAATMAKSLSPTTVASTVLKGAALRQAYLHPEQATPEMRKLVHALVTAGGRIQMDPFYRSTAAGSFVKRLGDLAHPGAILHDAWQMAKDSPVAAPMRIVGRLLDTLNHPLMGVMVPRAKLGVFSELAADFLRRNPNATQEDLADAMTKAWDSVDNRMGQLVYDNLFWNKLAKDIAFITTRSVGWNLGSAREIGGAAVDLAAQGARIGKGLVNVARGKKFGLPPELTNRMAYTIAMPIITAMFGALVTYLMTGQGPQQPLDLFYPPTGQDDGRTTMPGYIKDVMAFRNDPLGTIGNKTQPLFETMLEIKKNRDYFGGIINMPGVDNPLVSYPEYLLNQAIPFSWRGWMKSRDSGGGMLSQALNFWGIQNAPQSITNPEAGEAFQAREDKRAYRAREKENAKGRINFDATP